MAFRDKIDYGKLRSGTRLPAQHPLLRQRAPILHRIVPTRIPWVRDAWSQRSCAEGSGGMRDIRQGRAEQSCHQAPIGIL